MSTRYLEQVMADIVRIIFWVIGMAIVAIPILVHIVQCVRDDWAAMLIIGLVIPPVGWVHGVGIIFGVWG